MFIPLNTVYLIQKICVSYFISNTTKRHVVLLFPSIRNFPKKYLIGGYISKYNFKIVIVISD